MSHGCGHGLAKLHGREVAGLAKSYRDHAISLDAGQACQNGTLPELGRDIVTLDQFSDLAVAGRVNVARTRAELAARVDADNDAIDGAF